MRWDCSVGTSAVAVRVVHVLGSAAALVVPRARSADGHDGKLLLHVAAEEKLRSSNSVRRNRHMTCHEILITRGCFCESRSRVDDCTWSCGSRAKTSGSRCIGG